MNSDIEIYWKYCVRRVPWGFPRCPRKGTGGQASDGPPGSRHAPGGPRFTHAIFGGARAYASAHLNDFNAERGKRWCGRRHGLTSARNRANQPRGLGEREQKSLGNQRNRGNGGMVKGWNSESGNGGWRRWLVAWSKDQEACHPRGEEAVSTGG